MNNYKDTKLIIEAIKTNYSEVLEGHKIDNIEVSPSGKLLVSKVYTLTDFLTTLENTKYTNCKNIICIKDFEGYKRYFNISDELENHLAIKTLQVLKSKILNSDRIRIKTVFGKPVIKLWNDKSIELAYLHEVFGKAITLIKLQDTKRLDNYIFHNLDISITKSNSKGEI